MLNAGVAITSTHLQGISLMKRSIGVLLLGAWLILTGLAHLLHFSFSGMGTVMAGLATAAGIMIILGL
jgi:hypothetical protein